MTRYYVYFITPENKSDFVTFGQTASLGNRWYSYRNASPLPKCVGLIQCKSKSKMNSLEKHIKTQFQDVLLRGEWLYHTDSVKAFYRDRTNVDIEKHLSDAIEKHSNRVVQRHHNRYQNDPEYRERKQKYMREHQQKRRANSDLREHDNARRRELYHLKKGQKEQKML